MTHEIRLRVASDSCMAGRPIEDSLVRSQYYEGYARKRKTTRIGTVFCCCFHQKGKTWGKQTTKSSYIAEHLCAGAIVPVMTNGCNLQAEHVEKNLRAVKKLLRDA